MAGAAYLAGRDFTRAFALPVSLGFVIMKSLWWRPLGQGWNTRGSTLWLNATELFNPNSETHFLLNLNGRKLPGEWGKGISMKNNQQLL